MPCGVIQVSSRKAEESPIPGWIGGDDQAARAAAGARSRLEIHQTLPNGWQDSGAMRIDVVTIFPATWPRCARRCSAGRSRPAHLGGVHDLRDWTHDVTRRWTTPRTAVAGHGMRPAIWGAARTRCARRRRVRAAASWWCGRRAAFTQRRRAEYRRCRGGVRLGRTRASTSGCFDDASRRMVVDEVSIGDYVLVGGEVAVLPWSRRWRAAGPACSATRIRRAGLVLRWAARGPAYTAPSAGGDLAVRSAARR